MEEIHQITTDELTIGGIQNILEHKKKIALSGQVSNNIKNTRAYLDKKMETSETPFYGINNGFGSLHNVKISREKLSQLQENLVKSHASGTGDKVDQEIIKLMLLLKIQSLGYGHSGITLEVTQRLIDFYNEDVLPVVYEQGSLGASGDLAPLAHLALPVLGLGEVYYKGEIIAASEALKQLNWKPLSLRSKEGLALLNGTQFMSAHAVYALIKAFKFADLADVIDAVY